MHVPFFERLRVKVLYCLRRIFLTFKKDPFRGTYDVIECPVEILRDRFAQPFTQHPHLELFTLSKEDAIKLYQEYTSYIHTHQKKDWLENFGFIPRHSIPFWVAPWGGFEKKYEGYRLTRKYASRYLRKLWATKKSLGINGYNRDDFPPITGRLLVNDNGERRVIIWNGNRRTLSLVSLGYRNIPVEISGGNRWKGFRQETVIDIADVGNWENVRNGKYTPEQAYQFFITFFDKPTSTLGKDFQNPSNPPS